MCEEQHLLSLLRRQKGYVSGSILAKETGISKSRISKRIRLLRQYGYHIESSSKRGYRLAGETDLPLPWELAKVLDTLLIGKDKIIYRHTTESTQNLAISLAEKDPSSDGTVIIAGQQTSGRGRESRKWLSPKGGIWLSVILRPRISASKITILPFAAALAVCEAIKKTTQLNPKLRWPNDIMIEGKKVAGILIDISMEAEQINYAAIGIGINVNVDSSAISAYLEKEFKVTSLSDELGQKMSILGLTKEILKRLEYHYMKLKNDDTPHTIIEQWKKSSDIFHRKVQVIHKDSIIEGVAVDLNDDGSLLVRTAICDNFKVVASDVRVRY
ncbi:MAG: biotin--[acetyl-CoA-carboxylase] ligase [Thermoproteota archaeon]|nr:biotin--[acetyl-CoA-carboxylase] ligase [Thermoproteota archaeon]